MAPIVDQIVGHTQQIQLLKSAMEQNRLPSAHLFVGPAGVGKKLVARALVQHLVCENPTQAKTFSACGQCPPCIRLEKDQSESLLVLRPEKGVIKIEQASQAIRFFALRNLGKHRVIIIEDAHLLNAQAGNALLKSIEEPPENSFFILLAPSLSGVLSTIRSRCQTLRFGSLSSEQLRQLVSAPDWVISASQGRLDLAHLFLEPEMLEARNQAIEVFKGILEGASETTREDLIEVAKDRDKSLNVVRMWIQLVRDAWIAREGLANWIHRDQKSFIERLSSLSASEFEALTEQLFELEKHLTGPFERSLCLENFQLVCKKQVRGLHVAMD